MNFLINILINFIVVLMIFVSPVISMVDGEQQGNVVIQITPDARVNSREYLLKDIARIEAPGMMKEQLGNLSMGFSPSIGEVKRVSGRSLASKIKSISWLPESANISAPDSVFIKRPGQEVSQQTLKNLYHDYIQERTAGQAFEIRNFKVRGLDLYPMGNIDLSIRSQGNKEAKGRVSLYVDVVIKGVSQGRISVSGYVDMHDIVVCSTRTLSRGEILKAGDLCLKRLNISKIPDDYLTQMETIPGMRLKQNLVSGGYFRSNMLEKPPLIKRGDNVTLVAFKGNMRIVATGIADQDGGLGDRILVNNINSKRLVSGRVSGPKTVDVFF